MTNKTAPSNSNNNLRPSRELGERPSEQSQESPPANSNEEILKEILTDEFIDEYYDLFKWGVDVKRVLKEIIRIALSKKDEEIQKLKEDLDYERNDREGWEYTARRKEQTYLSKLRELKKKAVSYPKAIELSKKELEKSLPYWINLNEIDTLFPKLKEVKSP